MKKLLFLSILFLTTLLNAAGDSCSNAIELSLPSETDTSLQNRTWSMGSHYFYTYYKFTPSSNGEIVIQTTDMDNDSNAWLYDDIDECVSWWGSTVASDTRNNNDIYITYTLSAGTTYYLPIRNYTDDDDSFTLNLSFSSSFSSSSISNDICYDSISVSGLNFGFINVLSKTTIPIRNISNGNLSDVQVVLASDSLFSAFSNCDVLDGDGSETCSQTSDLSFFNTFTAFNSGVTYDLQTLISNNSKSAYVESLFSFLNSNDYDLLATYTKDGTTYSGKLSQCKSDTNETSDGRPFTIRNPDDTRNIRGNVKIIGNTVLCEKDSNGQCKETSDPNNNTTLSYIKEVDGFINASKAKISGIPDTAEVVWAGFYAQGYTNESLETVRADLNSQPMYLIAPDNTLFPLYPEVIDSLQWVGYTYSTFSTVNALIGKKGSEINGWWTGANIKASEGKDTSLGYFGAWTLVVIYKDSSESFRNITVFDGYTNISSYNREETIDLSGFLTPKAGDINSTFSFFAGEGDIAYTGDELYFNGYQIGNSNNVMYSHTSGFEKEPSLTNNFGIDIQNIDIGTSGADLLGYKDTSATVRFTSSGDSYYPSMFVFTTNLYTLDICYDYTYGQNGYYTTAPSIKPALIDGTFNKSTPLDLKVYFRNRENSDTTINNLNIDILNLKEAVYHLNSTKIAKTDTTVTNIDDNILDIASDKSYVKNIPIGSFGSLDYFYLYYSLDLNQSTLSEVPVDIEFRYDLTVDGIGLGTYSTKLSDMDPCQPTPGYEPVPDIFNIVQAGETKSDDPYYYFNIPTQVVNRVGNFLLESMDPNDLNKSKAVSKAQDVNITMVNMSGFHYTNATCTDPDNSIVIGTPVSTHFNINDTTVSIDKDAMRTAAVFSKASQNAAFRIIYTDENNNTKSICSRDNFAIRPESYSFKFTDYNHSNPLQQSFIIDNNGSNIKTAHLAAGYNYLLTMNATDHLNNTPVLGYTTSSLDANMTWQGTSSLVCNDESNITLEHPFVNGVAETNTTWNNVGSYKLHIIDTKWTAVDSLYLDHHTAPYFQTGADCIQNSSAVEDESSASKNGCNISSVHHNNDYSQDFQDMLVFYHPYRFDLNATAGGTAVTPTIGLLFTPVPGTTPYIYMADINNTLDENMSYHLNGSITALGENNVTLSNFVDQCYAVPLDINISTSNRDLNDSKGNHVPYRIRFHDINSSGSIINALDINLTETNPALQSNDIRIQTAQTYFPKNLNGTMQTRLNMNYMREKDTAVNPTTLTFIKYQVNCTNAVADCTFNADLINSKTTKGIKDLNSTIPVRHYYGRTNAPRQTVLGSDGNVSVYYEVFCNGATCNKSLLQDGNSSTSTDDPRWFVNTNHTSDAGTAAQTATVQKNGVNVSITREANGNHPDYIGVHYNGSSGYPYKATMENNASGWLIYNKYNANAATNEFQVDFVNPNANWAGIYETNATTNKNASDNTNRRLMW
ncbi:hypothetical protein [Sulfurimonas sp. NW9]|uniref:hypothetical protein n=1 Tax=Sulfurimonas sp. NW9 TaxID=2922728 RepID=UPI003DA9EF76